LLKKLTSGRGLECAATTIWTHKCFVRINPVKSQKKNKTFILGSVPW